MAITLSDFEDEALATLLEFATIESISPHYDHEWEERGHLHRAAQLIARGAARRRIGGLTVRVDESPGLTPLVVVEVPSTAPGLEGTVLFYGHLDKQPPLGQWSDGLSPFAPVRRGNRVYARGVSDDGYAAFAALLAIEDLEARGVPHARCVLLVEASEESGSPDLPTHLDRIGDELGRVELLICLDSGAMTYDRLWVTSSLRGNLLARLRVDVLERGQHSGIASGVVPSSFRVLRQLLDRLEDSTTGRVLLPDLQAVVPASHRATAERVVAEFGDVAAAELPAVSGLQLMGENATERLLNRTWAPTLSVTGIGGIPDVASAGNVLRPYTEVVISLRLPPNVDGKVAEAAVTRALTTDVPARARVTLEVEAANGWCSPELAPWLAAALEGASQSAFGRPAEFVGEGGTIPFLAMLGERFANVQFVATGVGGPGSNAHGIDEMLDLDMVVGVTNAVAEIVAAHAARGEESA